MCQAQQHAQGDGACASGPLRIAFLHPDLGLGGAERLVVDAAVELASRGHTVDMYTSHHDRSRCFEETTSGHFAVLVAGAWFPRFILGRLGVPCAWARCLLAAIYVLFCAWRSGEHYHVRRVTPACASAIVSLDALVVASLMVSGCYCMPGT